MCNDEEQDLKDSKDESLAKSSKNIPDQKSTESSTNKDTESPQTKRRKVDVSDPNSKTKLRSPENTSTESTTPSTLVSLSNEEQSKIKDVLTHKPSPQINSPIKSQTVKTGEIISPPTLTTTKTTLIAPATSISNIYLLLMLPTQPLSTYI